MPDFKDRLAFGVRRLKTSVRARLAPEEAPSSNGAPSLNLLEGAPPTFFIVGRAKSGTSWLMRMLDAHPEILCKGEGRFFGRDYTREDPEEGGPQPTSLYGAMSHSKYVRAWIEKSVWTRGEDVDEHLANLTSLATNYFLARRLAEVGKRIVGDKTPFTGAEVVEEIKEIRPDAKLIHIIRDGRDVAISAIHHMWNHARQEGGIHDLSPEELAKREAYRADPEAFLASGQSIFTGKQLAGTAKNWAEMVERAMEDGPKLLGERYAEVRYEDLLERPEPDLERLLKFLEADAGEKVVERCVERASFARRTKGRERGQEDSRAFMRKGIAGDWKNVFTEEDKRVFKEAAGGLLIRLGYEKDYDW